MAIIIDGKKIAQKIREDIKKEVEILKNEGISPGLVTILVGNDPASHSYVKAKQRVAQNLGFYSVNEILPENTSEEELIKLIQKYNENPKIHGILVQLPLPAHINEEKIINHINPLKDVDGFHPENLGLLVRETPRYIPCTPFGILKLLEEIDFSVEGKEAVVVGRSNIVGKPMAILLSQKRRKTGNATVTLCHSKTQNLKKHTRRADLLIVAIGKPRFITEEMVKEGAVVIDVGVNKVGETSEGKAILCGDVDFEKVKEKVYAITPVPGGVGPMTITMLMMNTLKAAKILSKI